MEIKFYLKSYLPKKDRTNKAAVKLYNDTESQIYARISYNGDYLKYYTNEKIKPCSWNSKTQRAKRSNDWPEYSEFNTRLDNIGTKIRNTFRQHVNDNDGKEPSKPILKNLLDKAFHKNPNATKEERDLKTFWGYFDNFIMRCENGTRLHLKSHTPLSCNTIKNLKVLKHHLKCFEKKKGYKLDFDNIDLSFHNKFLDYCTRLAEPKKLQPNTIGKLITNLKVVLKESFDDRYNKNSIFTHRKFFSPTVETDAVYLNQKEIDEIAGLELCSNKRLERVRDLFLIQCHTGVRFIDLPQIHHQNLRDDIFEITQIKTQKPAFIPLKKEVAELLAKYNGVAPAKISNDKFNKYIQEVCKLVDSLQSNVVIEVIENGKRVPLKKKNDLGEDVPVQKFDLVTSHTGRRSFATNEYILGDLSVREIMTATGHKTEKSFFKYIRMTPRDNAESAVRKIKEREAKSISILETKLKAV